MPSIFSPQCPSPLLRPTAQYVAEEHTISSLAVSVSHSLQWKNTISRIIGHFTSGWLTRSTGPEFGGSIGIVFYLGLVFNTSLNAVGLIDCSIENFGSRTGSMSQWLPQSYWWQFLWATVVLMVCTLICLAGSGLFARCSNGLLVILLVAIISIPISAFIKEPYVDDKHGIIFTGFSFDTLRANLMPHFTKGAAGSVTKHRENFQDLFGILFPALSGILAYVVLGRREKVIGANQSQWSQYVWGSKASVQSHT